MTAKLEILNAKQRESVRDRQQKDLATMAAAAAAERTRKPEKQ